MTSCLDMSTSAFIQCPHTPPRVPPVPAADAGACAPASPALRNNSKAEGERRTLLLRAADDKQQPQEEEDSRSFHRRNLKRKQSEQGDGTSQSASGGDRRNVRRKRRERAASLKADDNEAQDLRVRSEEGTGNNRVAGSFEVFSGKNNNGVTPAPDAKATALAMAAKQKAQAGLEGGGREPLEDCAGGNDNNNNSIIIINARHVPLPSRHVLEEPVRKLVAALNEKPLVPVAGESAPFRRAPLSADDDDSGEDDADPNRPCRMIQFVSVTHRRQLMQALHCNNATAMGAGAGGPRHPSSSPLHQRWREEVGLAAATRYGVRDGPLLASGVVAKKRWGDYGSCSSTSDDDDDDDSTTSSKSTDDSTTSSSTGSSHDCDGSSVESDLTTDPRLFALSTSAAAARMSASAASDADPGDRYRYALDMNGEDYDAHGGNGGRHYRLNLPPEVAWKALIVLSIFVVLLDLIYSTVADVVVRVVNRPRRKNRPRP